MRRGLLRAGLVLLAAVAIGVTLWVGARALRDGALADAGLPPEPASEVREPAAPTPSRPPLTGTVKGPDGRPRPGVRVELDGRRTETDAEGEFRFDDPPAGPVDVAIWDAGHGLETRRVGPGESVTVRLRAIAPISGVLEMDGGVRLAGAPILVRDRTGTEVHVTTDHEGRFGVDHLPGGTYTVMLSPFVADDGTAWQRTYVSVNTGRRGREDIVLKPQRGAVIRGVVRGPDGAPCGGATCQASARGPTSILHGDITDEEGRFELVVPPDRETKVLIDTPDDMTGWRFQRWFQYTLVGDGETLDIRLAPGTTISGRVEAPRGMRIAGRTIGAYRRVGRDRRHICTGRVGDDGAFELRGLWEDAYYELRVEGVGGQNDSYVLSSGYNVASGTRDLALRLVVPRSFAGTVRTSTGEPFAGGRLIVHHTTAGWSGYGGTDDDGAFEILRTPPGKLRLIVLKPGRAAGSWELGEFRADDRAADVRLP